MSRQSRSLLRIFGIPLVIFGVGLAGLVLALLVDNFGEKIAALSVGIPIAIFAWVIRRHLTKS